MDHQSSSSTDSQYTELGDLLPSTDYGTSTSLSSLDVGPPVPPKSSPPLPPKPSPAVSPKDSYTGIESLRSSGLSLSPKTQKRISISGQIKQKYPLTVTDLTKADLKLLTAVLDLEDSPLFVKQRNGEAQEMVDERIKSAIETLPVHLQRSFLFRLLPNPHHRTAFVCNSHRNLNIYVIGHLFSLIKQEVTEHLRIMDMYADILEPEARNLVRALQAMQGMWWTPSSSHLMPPIGAAMFQSNKCEACMLTRVTTEPMFLRNLRVTLLSRTRTRSKHRVPRLLPFVDAAINSHKDDAYGLFISSSTMAYGMKAGRKSAVKAYKEERRRQHTRHLESLKSRLKEKSTQSIMVFMSTGGNENENQQSNQDEHQDQHQHPTDNSLDTECTARDSERDTVDDIISKYAAIKSTDSTPRTGRPTQIKELPNVSPLSVKKPIGSSIYSAMGAGKRHSVAGYFPPRENINWQDIIRQRSPLDKLADGVKDMLRERPASAGNAGDSEEFAEDYRHLLGPEEGQPGSHVSQGSWEDVSVKESGPGDTTWSLVCKTSKPPRVQRHKN
ncbi:hypothetical protein ASPWEDRAFT_27440 [Aspergillus wentii DTO 134E9]|uniref:Uncharacterized protein n=1 Tax=Aspergillus wentii DTO 134E9 TaxID=1073089 RepID=A0A1L9RIQ0_ASPWE|nr:uncharacterized protein ASPWEDRAFT_27440 [Aspergillus wentii DTO 134E9]KAI9932290.1 hypothetical protein MW887_009802 [Aspergillus wentii]OJJ34748.1 hypothetical protein ASPWEDRAFT_27440 [Aspergillus wentii DTO 134E9]